MVEKLGGVLSAAVSDALKSRDTLGASVAPVQAGGFADAISKALQSASLAANQADQLGKRLQMDDPTVSVEETVIAMNTSSLQFTGLVQARNKIAQAYSDIMNMPV